MYVSLSAWSLTENSIHNHVTQLCFTVECHFIIHLTECYLILALLLKKEFLKNSIAKAAQLSLGCSAYRRTKKFQLGFCLLHSY